MDPVTGIRETVCKVQGITLSYIASQTVNFDFIKALVLGGDDTKTVTVHTERKTKCKRADAKIHIVTEPEDKNFRVSFLKRWRLCDNTSVHSAIFKRGVWRSERSVMCEDLRYKHPFTCIINGPSRSANRHSALS